MTAKSKLLLKRIIESASTNSHRIHITPRLEGWAVRKEANLKATRVFSTEKEAISFAKSLKEKEVVSQIILHNRRGKFKAVG